MSHERPSSRQGHTNPPPLNKHLGHDTQQRRLSLKFNSVFVIETRFRGWVDPEDSDDDIGGKDGSVPKGGIRCPDERRSRKKLTAAVTKSFGPNEPTIHSK